MVGTITPTEKKYRTGEDIPFIKLSNSALNDVAREWFREAVLKVKTNRNDYYYTDIRVTTLKDKKQVMFLHTQVVGKCWHKAHVELCNSNYSSINHSKYYSDDKYIS